MPKVSVVIAFLNGANFLDQAVASVLGQKLEDWELILFDDGSADSSAAFAQKLAKGDARVRYAAHAGRATRGPAASRLAGARQARGRYLLFLDHDDLLYPGALRAMAEQLDANPRAGALFAGTLFWAFDSALEGEDWVSTYRPFPTGMIGGRRMLRDLIRSDARHPALCSTMFVRRHYLDACGRIEPYGRIYEDTAVLMALLADQDVYILDQPLSAYRLHAQSASHKAMAAGDFRPVGYNRERHDFLRWIGRRLRLDLPSRAQLAVTLARYAVLRAAGSLGRKRRGSALGQA